MAVRARLVAQLEDYRYQLSTVDEEMREIREKLQQAEVCLLVTILCVHVMLVCVGGVSEGERGTFTGRSIVG